MSDNQNPKKNNFAESFQMFATSLYQVAVFLTTFVILGGKAVFDLLHEKLVKPQKRKEND